LEKALNNLKNYGQILSDNKENTDDSVRSLPTQSVSKARATKYTLHPTVLARRSTKPLCQYTRADVDKLIARTN